ncbi:MAG TPA: SDR family oxidoreductase [Xanthobacteraceae bacterium]|nr:SDR family oxidoreductase [Xanthobacteraceae bacterium]
MSPASTSQGELAGQVALVTGGVRRIGRAIALTLARQGAAIAVNAKSSRDEAADAVREIEALGGAARVIMGDVSDEADVARMVKEIASSLGPVDILINNAAVRRDDAFAAMSFADWRCVLSVILDGAFLMSRAVIPGMLAKSRGAIINIGGLTAHTGAFGRAHVSAAKAGLVGLTKALAVEFGSSGITVNCVAPGRIGGPRSANSGRGGVIPGGGNPLVGRDGEPEDIAAAVKLLCSPAGRYITGQTIHVNGGIYLP